jgi:hypothetical protein
LGWQTREGVKRRSRRRKEEEKKKRRRIGGRGGAVEIEDGKHVKG